MFSSLIGVLTALQSKVFVKDSRSVYHIVPTGRGHYKYILSR